MIARGSVPHLYSSISRVWCGHEWLFRQRSGSVSCHSYLDVSRQRLTGSLPRAFLGPSLLHLNVSNTLLNNSLATMLTNLPASMRYTASTARSATEVQAHVCSASESLEGLLPLRCDVVC